MAGQLTIIGMGETGPESLSAPALSALANAQLIIAAPRFHEALSEQRDLTAKVLAWPQPYSDIFRLIDAATETHIVLCTTGDPLWFGAGSGMLARFGQEKCHIIPHLSGFQLAAHHMGWAINDCETVTIHGRPIASILPYLYRRARGLVLAENRHSPHKLAELLDQHGFGTAQMRVLAHLGGRAEAVFCGQASGWSHDVPDFHMIAVQCPDLAPKTAGFGFDDAVFEHSGKLTKREARASALAKLAPFPGAVFWDVGAGSGAVAIEFMNVARRCRAFAIDKDPQQLAMARRNAARCGLPALSHIEADLPAGLDDLPAPDAIFIGGGLSPSVLRQCYDRLQPGGNLVAHAVTLETEVLLLQGWQDYGGTLTRITVNFADPVGGYHGWRPLMPVTQWHVTKPQI